MKLLHENAAEESDRDAHHETDDARGPDGERRDVMLAELGILKHRVDGTVDQIVDKPQRVVHANSMASFPFLGVDVLRGGML